LTATMPSLLKGERKGRGRCHTGFRVGCWGTDTGREAHGLRLGG
jgi:hypothetical protein